MKSKIVCLVNLFWNSNFENSDMIFNMVRLNESIMNVKHIVFKMNDQIEVRQKYIKKLWFENNNFEVSGETNGAFKNFRWHTYSLHSNQLRILFLRQTTKGELMIVFFFF